MLSHIRMLRPQASFTNLQGTLQEWLGLRILVVSVAEIECHVIEEICHFSKFKVICFSEPFAFKCMRKIAFALLPQLDISHIRKSSVDGLYGSFGPLVLCLLT